VVAIETLLDVDKLRLVNVIRCLKVAEEELEAPPPMVNHVGKLYPLEVWEERWKQRDTKKPSSSGPGGRGGERHGGCSNRGHDNGDSHGSNGSSSSGLT
jgi:hypothetical protein